MHDDRTPGGMALPHPDNKLEDDVLRLRAALRDVDGILAALAQTLGTKASQQELNTAIAALQTGTANLSATVTFLSNTKVGVVNGLQGPSVTLKPPHLGLGPANGPSNVSLVRDGLGRIAQATQTVDGKQAVAVVTYDGNGRVSRVVTTYDGRKRTEDITYQNDELASVQATEGAV
jgi:hypothetical protein